MNEKPWQYCRFRIRSFPRHIRLCKSERLISLWTAKVRDSGRRYMSIRSSKSSSSTKTRRRYHYSHNIECNTFFDHAAVAIASATGTDTTTPTLTERAEMFVQEIHGVCKSLAQAHTDTRTHTHTQPLHV